MIRILIVDDHQILRDGLRQMLGEEQSFHIIGEAANGRDAVELAGSLKPDVILMDVSMPLMDGSEATARIHALDPTIRVLALTMLDQGSFVQLMLRNGAAGYLLKDTGKEELVQAIHDVYGGKRYLAAKATDLLIGNVTRQQLGAKSYIPSLTRREKEVLSLISQGLSDQDISGSLFISPSTVESHRKNLRSKLGARNAAEIVRIAMERGLLDDQDNR